MTSFERFERFAEEHPELEHNVNVDIAPPNIDHGRLLTHKRRELFSRLHAEVSSGESGIVWEIPNNALLSPRRIDRILAELDLATGLVPRGRISEYIADEIFRLMQDWLDTGLPRIVALGLPVVVGRAGRVLGWTIRLVLT